MRFGLVGVILAAVSGCYAPSFDDCQLACSSQGTCPDGLTCTAGVCRTAGASGACSGGMDGGADAPPPPPMFSVPEEVLFNNGSGSWSDPAVNSTETEMYIVSMAGEVHRSTRPPAGAMWSTPVAVGELNYAARTTRAPYLRGGDRIIYVSSDRPGALGATDIWVATRTSLTAPWGQPSLVNELSSNKDDAGGSVTMDGKIVVLDSSRGFSTGIYIAYDTTGMNGWGAPMPLDELNSNVSITNHPSISPDGLSIVFASNRAGGEFDIYFATRSRTTDAFSTPMPIAALATPEPELDPWMSADGQVIYFAKGTAGNRKIYRSTRLL